MELFGYEINRKKAPTTEKSFVAPDSDGAVESINAGGHYGIFHHSQLVSRTNSFV